MTLVEELSEAAHEAWMATKRSQGVDSRRSEWDEELMVPYADLSEQAKDLDRGTVRGVLDAAERAGYVVVPRSEIDAVKAVCARSIAGSRPGTKERSVAERVRRVFDRSPFHPISCQCDDCGGSKGHD